MIKTKIKIDVYGTYLLFIVTDDLYDAVVRNVKHAKDEEYWTEEYAKTLHGVTLTSDAPPYTVVIKDDSLTYNTIVHELFHVSRTLAARINITEDEPVAWLIGYLSERIFKFLADKKIEVKHG